MGINLGVLAHKDNAVLNEDGRVMQTFTINSLAAKLTRITKGAYFEQVENDHFVLFLTESEDDIKRITKDWNKTISERFDIAISEISFIKDDIIRNMTNNRLNRILKDDLITGVSVILDEFIPHYTDSIFLDRTGDLHINITDEFKEYILERPEEYFFADMIYHLEGD